MPLTALPTSIWPPAMLCGRQSTASDLVNLEMAFFNVQKNKPTLPSGLLAIKKTIGPVPTRLS